MLIKFFELNCLKQDVKFSTDTRTNLDLFLLYQTCRYFQPKKILEIGFSEGRSLSAMIQACDSSSEFVSIDITFENDKIFKNLHPNDLERINFVQTDSKKFNYTGTFDLVLVDGCHEYDYAYADICNSSTILQNGIMIVDDYTDKFPGVIKAVDEFLYKNKNWSPFMKGDSIIWLHQTNHDANFFLDQFIQNRANNFISFYNDQMLDYIILTPSTCKAFNEHSQLMQMACKLYNL
jgi:hypothetical protein